MTNIETPAKKHFVRFSREDDFAALMDFYKANPHKNVCDRNLALLRELVTNGSVTLIQAEDGEIIASSISYPLQDANGTQKWLEIGTTRIVKNGYPGLFDVMIAMQVMRAFLVEPPEERYVCQMESPAVRKLAHHMGFRPFVPSQELVDVSDFTVHAAESAGFDNWYSAGPEALPMVAQRLQEAISKPYLTHLKSGEKMELDFSKSKFFALFKEEFADLAKRNMGDLENPDYTASVASTRQKWMRWYFR